MNELLDPPQATVPSREPRTKERVSRVSTSGAPRRELGQAQFADEEPRGIFARHRGKLFGGMAFVTAGVVCIFAFKNNKPAHTKSPDRNVVRIQLPPLPPPPPPPPPPPSPPVPKMEEPKQEMIKEDKPDEKPPEEPKPADDPPPLGTGIKGDGAPDGFGLSGSGTGRVGGTGLGGGSRSKWGWYAGQVQRTVSDALRNHRKTRSARFSALEVRIWPDSATGRITRVTLSPSTGDAALDAAIRDEVIGGLQLSQVPPAGMPSPIVMRINARRP